MRKWKRLLVPPLAAGLLAGCGTNGTDASDEADAETSPEVITVTEVTTVVESDEATPEDKAEEESDGEADDESESADGPDTEGTVDANASRVLIDSVIGDTAILLSPTENIACDIHEAFLTCRISSWYEDTPHGVLEAGGNSIPYNSVGIQDGAVSINAASDALTAMAHKHGAPEYGPYPQILQYGETITHGPYSCTSTFDAMICEDTVTGAGASMSRAGAELF